jgi:cytochrome c-type biogenesis protein CcmF
LLSGIGPAIAWRRATAANLRRNLLLPVCAGLVTLAALLAFGVDRKPQAIAMFCLAAFVIAVVGQEMWRGAQARRAMTGEAPPAALVSLVRRNRRRYGGYTVHAGVAVLFVGVAASSAFQSARDVRMSPGQTARVGGYDVTYVRPTATLASEKVSLGAVLALRKDGKRVGELRTTRGYYPSMSEGQGPVSAYFNGNATSEVGLRAGMRRDVWTAVQPDLQSFQGLIREADQRFRMASPDAQGLVIAALAERYRRQPPPATFRLIVSPLVSWIWIGALIAIGGGLIALWPAPVAVRRRVAAAAGGRLAREPARS